MYDIIKDKVYAVVPARSGSKGVKNKNIKTLCGHPLLSYSIIAAKKTKSTERIIISSDSPEYIKIAKSYGAEAPFIRPSEISGDKSSDYECIKHMLDFLQENEGHVPEYIIHLRPTTPFRDPVLIDEAVHKIMSERNATALRSAHEMSETAYKCLEIKNSLFKPLGATSFDMDVANLPRQMFPKTYSANGYIDILKSSFIASAGKIHGDHVVAFVTPVTLEVDTAYDFKALEQYAAENIFLIERLFT
ncbi:cytidylyltransferase domain-containing protein [Thermodesulfobacteriota bacterium]